jgi:uracil DNA glycosylase
MKWESFKDQFHESWHNKMQPFIESKECDEIYKHLKERSKKGHRIAPSSSVTFRCFWETPLTDVKAVVMGYCPYHSFVDGYPVADGLALGCSVTGRLQPSLESFYEGIEGELYKGMNLNFIKSPDVTYLTSQGILMCNAALTTEKDKAGSHMKIWEPFTKYLLSEVLEKTGAPVLFLGKEAAKYQRNVALFTHSFVVDHPAFAARTRTIWDTKGAFKKMNTIIKENHGIEINWLDIIPF